MNIDFANENVVQSISNLTLTKKNVKVGKKYVYVKRLIDCIISSIALVLLLPIFLLISIAIRLDSEGPIFFAHTRIGKNGKPIKIYKFRTMVVNAEEMIKKFTPEQMKEYKENYKLNNDPRIIGPRPVVKAELEKYGENASKFLSVTPGLTGNWAANGRSISAYDERMQLELYYVDNISLKMDLKIFFKTIVAVIKREGAM